MRDSLVMLAFLLILTSCGSDRPGNQDAYQFGTSDCSREFISAYNSMLTQAAFVDTTKDLDTYQTSVNEFRNKYQSVRCDASVGGHRETIDASAKADEISKLIEEKKKSR